MIVYFAAFGGGLLYFCEMMIFPILRIFVVILCSLRKSSLGTMLMNLNYKFEECSLLLLHGL